MTFIFVHLFVYNIEFVGFLMIKFCVNIINFAILWYIVVVFKCQNKVFMALR